MIAKDPADRQQSMTEVISDLEAAMAGEPFTERQVAQKGSSDSALSEFFHHLEAAESTGKPKHTLATEAEAPAEPHDQETIEHHAREEDTGVGRTSRLTPGADESGETPDLPADPSTPQVEPHTKVLAKKEPSQRKQKSIVFWVTLGGGALGLMILVGLCLFLVGDAGSSTPPGENGGGSATLFGGMKAGELWDGNGLRIKFCWCPPGKFKMGSPEGEPGRGDDEGQVDVTLTKGFWMGQTEVTQAQWKVVMKTQPEQWGTQADTKAGDEYPATSISWVEAKMFCEALTRLERAAGRLPPGWEYRLPTEAQWEYACRAGTSTAYSFGGDALHDYAWYGDNTTKAGEGYAHQVARKKPNPWGLYDMHGNAREWCRDWYHSTLPGGTDPEATNRASSRVCRGGGWRNGAGSCRAAGRYGHTPDFWGRYLGFRLAAVQSSQ